MAPFLWGHSFVFGGVNFCWSDLKLRLSFGKPGPPKPMPRHRKTNLFTNIQEYPTTLTKYNMAGEESLIKAKKKVDIYNILYTLYLLFWQFILIVSAFLGCFNLCVPPPKKKHGKLVGFMTVRQAKPVWRSGAWTKAKQHVSVAGWSYSP